jgi:hypothetical protein
MFTEICRFFRLASTTRWPTVGLRGIGGLRVLCPVRYQARGGVAGWEGARRPRPGGRPRRREQVPLVGAGARRSGRSRRQGIGHVPAALDDVEEPRHDALQVACVAAVAGRGIELAVRQERVGAEVGTCTIRVRLRVALTIDHPAATVDLASRRTPRIARRRATVARCKARRGSVHGRVASIVPKRQAATARSRRPTCAQNDRQQHQVTHEEPPGESRTPASRSRHVPHEHRR